MQNVHVNFLAIAACAIASMVVGFVWYGPLFRKAWMKSIGLDPNSTSPERIKQMQSEAGPGYAAMFVGSLVMAYIFKHVLVNFKADTISLGL